MLVRHAGLNGYHWQNISTTLVPTLPWVALRLKSCMVFHQDILA